MKNLKILEPIGFLLLYVTVGYANIHFGHIDKLLYPIWFPTGLAIGYVLVFGRSSSCVIFLGAFLLASSYLFSSSPLFSPFNIFLQASLFAVIAVSEALFAAWLMRRKICTNSPLESPSSVVCFFVNASIAMIPSALIVTVLAFYRDNAPLSFGLLFLQRLHSRFLGVLLLTPIILLWKSKINHEISTTTLRLESFINISLVLTFSITIIMGHFFYPGMLNYEIWVACLAIPLLMHSALRLGRKVTLLLLLIIGCTIVVDISVVNHHMFFNSVEESVLFIQFLATVISVTVMFLVASTYELKKTAHELRISDDLLQENLGQLKAIFDQASVGICITDLEGRIINSNSVFARITDYTTDEIISRRISDFYCDGDMSNEKELKEAMGNGLLTTYSQEIRLVTKLNKTVWGNFSVSPLRLRNDEINGYIYVVEEISRRKYAEGEYIKLNNALELKIKERTKELYLSNKKFINYVNNVPMGYIELSKDAKIVDWNPFAVKLYGYLKAETLGKDIFDLLFIKGKADLAKDYFKTTTSVRVNIENVTSQGQILFCEWIIIALYNEKCEHVGWTILSKDITEESQVKAKIRKAKTEAELANKAKSEFIANMSHEIRTPLNTVIGLADLLQTTELDHDQMQYVKSINKSGETLLEIINNILELSKIESGAVIIEETSCKLQDITNIMIDILDPKAKAKHIGLHVQIEKDVPEVIITDQLKLKQVLLNLLTNAIKFTEKGSVTLRVSVSQDHLHFEIKDSGIGLSSEQIGDLFTRFMQVDSSSTRGFGGSGLGLFITKDLVTRLNGEIKVSSEMGVGSIFTITLPLQIGKQEDIKVTSVLANTSIDNRPLKILLVEDSEDNRFIIQSYIKSLPYKITIAENGKIAVEKFKQDAFDLVLMDMQMPVMDGFEATRQIREWERNTNRSPVPIIAITAHAMKEERQKTLQAGCSEHLSKPIKKADLLKSIMEQTLLLKKVS